MNLSQLADLGEFIGGVAVLVTLVYLAVQIRQNTQAVTLNTQKEMWTSLSDLASEVTQNSDVARLLLAANEADRSLSPEDEVRLEWFLTRLVGEYESAYSQWVDGLFETKHWLAYDAHFRDRIGSPGVRRYWDTHKHWYFDAFVTYVDSQVYPVTEHPQG